MPDDARQGLSLLHLKYLSFANSAKTGNSMGSWIGPIQVKVLGLRLLFSHTKCSS